MTTLFFCDINKKFIDACQLQLKMNDTQIKSLGYNVELRVGDISKIQLENAAYVSPANGFATMGGGIDHVFATKMFPGIHKIVMNKIEKLDTKIEQIRCYEDHNGDLCEYEDIVPYLPVGNVIVTELSRYPKYASCHLFTSPTMIEPSNVANTNNAYLCMKAVLTELANHQDIKMVVICGFCTGVGGMTEQESAKQIFKAICEIENKVKK